LEVERNEIGVDFATLVGPLSRLAQRHAPCWHHKIAHEITCARLDLTKLRLGNLCANARMRVEMCHPSDVNSQRASYVQK
jgi:hypothetical protein